MANDHNTTSIQLRLRRIVYEDAFVAVPATSAIIDLQPDGTGKINYEAFVAEAIAIGADPRVEWRRESVETIAHPLQMRVPEGRFRFDAHYPAGAPEEPS